MISLSRKVNCGNPVVTLALCPGVMGYYDVLYLDFSKAFDKVPHHSLLLKLQAHGVDEKVAVD